MSEAKIAKELADRLVLLGLKRGDCRIEDDTLGERCCSVARWKIGPSAIVDIYCYFGKYFGASHVWVGFGSPRADRISTVMASIDSEAYSAIVFDDWDDGLHIVDSRKMAELKQRKFTAFENYVDRPNHWAWFGQYFRNGDDIASKALPLLRLVIQQLRATQPLATNVHVGATEAKRLMKARLAQDKFRQAVMNRWGCVCALTGCEIAPALEAAHIRSWSSNDDPLRTSPENGLLLSRTLHALFDLGLISFSADGRLKISRYVDGKERKRLGIKEGQKLLGKGLSPQQKKNMTFHRKQSLVDA
ncbi:HNH endonuclease [Rhodopseudomonas palustris]|nr:HNH endonuclease signature motif containing protein [Rhodopseudomonas palustris]